MKKFFRYTLVTLVALAVLGVAAMYAFTAWRNARPAPEALAALEPGDTLDIRMDRWLVMKPRGRDPRVGVIVYPGANADVRGYATTLRGVAEAGYLVVGVPMPFDFAIFAGNRALAVRDDFPDVQRWVLIGHSMGGAMAARFVHEHPGFASGLILWDSYPPSNNSLAEAGIPVWNIHRAKPDGSPPQSFVAQRHLFPADSTWVGIPGGNHMQFGAYSSGRYVEEWQASIDGPTQWRLVTAATLDALASM